jgi:SAM-dependent methyltransferase
VEAVVASRATHASVRPVARRDVSIHDRDRWVFNRLAEDYRARPGYPPALVSRLVALAGGEGRRCADLGAGIGGLALPLARAGLIVHAVEPARAMLDLLASDAAGLPVTPLHAAAEATGLGDGAFDLILLADALQWIDLERTAREAARLLAPGGVLAVVDPRPGPTPFMSALGERIASANVKARPRPLPVDHFYSLALCAAPRRERFDDAVALDEARLDAVLRSISYVGPAIGPGALEALLADAKAIARNHGGAVWSREIGLWWGGAKSVVPCVA